MKPLAIDLYCGLGGWAEGFLEEGCEVIGFDIERRPYPGDLALQDVRTLHGSQFREAAVIVASPPCQEPSYRAMPWSRAKALNAQGPPAKFIELFETCFRIQREASEAAGRHIPLIVENVKGAQRWIGRAKWHYGSYYLWGDVPALMPKAKVRKGSKGIADGVAPLGTGSTSWFFGKRADPRDVRINGGNLALADGTKIPLSGRARFADGLGSVPSRSEARKHASAMIAKIPFPLAQYIARVFKPEGVRSD